MLLKKSFIFPLVFLISLLSIHYSFCIDSVFKLSGTYTAPHINVNVGILKGNGLVNSNDISITCHDFQFTGTIRCNGTCTIHVTKDFDPTIFKKEGTGTITIIINPDDIEKHTQETLLAKAHNVLFTDPAITEELINKHLLWLRMQTAENNLDKSAIVKAISDHIMQLLSTAPITPISFVNVSREQPDELKAHKLFAFLGLWVGLYTLFSVYNLRHRISKKIGYPLGLISCGILFKTYQLWVYEDESFNSSLSENANHGKTIILSREKLLLIQTKLNEVFAQPYVSNSKILVL